MTQEREDGRTQENIATLDDLRSRIADGFAFVRSREVNASVSTITMEECIANAVVEIEDDRSDIRPGKLSRIRALKESVLGAIDQALQLPEDAFEHPDQGSANTPEEPEAEEEETTT